MNSLIRVSAHGLLKDGFLELEMVFVTQLVCWRPRGIIFLLWQPHTHPSNEALLDHHGANGHCPDLHLLQHLSAFLSSMLTFFFVRRLDFFLLGCSSVQSHSDKALSLVGPEPTRLRIRGLRPGQGTARTYQGLPAGVCLPVGYQSFFFWRRWSKQSLYASPLLSPMWPKRK